MPDREKQYNIDIISALAKHTITKMWVVIILLVIYCGVMTYFYIEEKSSYETTEATVEVDTGEGDAYVAGIGDVYYGESAREGENP